MHSIFTTSKLKTYLTHCIWNTTLYHILI